MNTLAVCLTFLAGICLAQGTLLDNLNTLHSNPSFGTLPHADQILIIELIAEIEAGELKAYIDQVGFHHVLAIIDKLPAAEAHVLNQLLVQELQMEENVNATTTMPAVGKRDLVAVLNTVMANPTFQLLPVTDQELIKNMVTAAENNTLTAFVQSVGYSTILVLMDALPRHEAHMIEQYMFQHLDTETATLGKK